VNIPTTFMYVDISSIFFVTSCKCQYHLCIRDYLLSSQRSSYSVTTFLNFTADIFFHVLLINRHKFTLTFARDRQLFSLESNFTSLGKVVGCTSLWASNWKH
jgi:hypothetical protein